MKKLLLAMSVAILLGAAPAMAQTTTGNEFQTQQTGKTVVGVVQMGLNPAGKAVPSANDGGSGGYNTAAVPVVNAAKGVAAGASTTIPAAAGKTSYVCGFEVAAVGGTAQFAVTLAGLKGPSGAVTFTYQMSSAAGGAMFVRSFNPCIPANAAAAAITLTAGSATGATEVDVNLSGYQQ